MDLSSKPAMVGGNGTGMRKAKPLGANGHGQRANLQQDFNVDYTYGAIPTAWNYGFDGFTDTPVNDFGYADVQYMNPVQFGGPAYFSPAGFI